MRSKKTITVVTFNANAGLVYQRAHIPFVHLKDKYDFRFADIDSVGHSDLFYTDAVVFVHGWTNNFTQLAVRIRQNYGAKLIVDTDDLLMELPVDHPDFGHIKARPLVDTLQLADHCVYSTPYLMHKLAHLNKNKTVIENAIPAKYFDEKYKPINKPHKQSFTIGWTGGQTHRSDQLHTFLPGVDKFLLDNEDARAHFHGLCPQSLLTRHGSQVYFDDGYVDFLDFHALCQTFPFDVCLVGLMEHAFNDAKSDLRLLDMAPHMIPIIASPRADFLKHKDKEIMLYADDTDPEYMSWYEAIDFAKKNKKAMTDMATRAKDYVLTERTSTVAAAKWDDLFTSLLDI